MLLLWTGISVTGHRQAAHVYHYLRQTFANTPTSISGENEGQVPAIPIGIFPWIFSFILPFCDSVILWFHLFYLLLAAMEQSCRENAHFGQSTKSVQASPRLSPAFQVPSDWRWRYNAQVCGRKPAGARQEGHLKPPLRRALWGLVMSQQFQTPFTGEFPCARVYEWVSACVCVLHAQSLLSEAPQIIAESMKLRRHSSTKASLFFSPP